MYSCFSRGQGTNGPKLGAHSDCCHLCRLPCCCWHNHLKVHLVRVGPRSVFGASLCNPVCAPSVLRAWKWAAIQATSLHHRHRAYARLHHPDTPGEPFSTQTHQVSPSPPRHIRWALLHHPDRPDETFLHDADQNMSPDPYASTADTWQDIADYTTRGLHTLVADVCVFKIDIYLR